jgi:UDP-GlcNAc:undecaprenyl-phosphate GlcNAc-1-phosphate transferase
MNGIYLKMGLALVTSLVISLVATPLVKKFACKVGAVDVPTDGRRMHNHPIPRMGGLAIFVGFVLSVLLFAKIDKQIQGMLIGAVIIVAVGAVDDVYPLPALFKFAVQIVAALVAVLHGVQINIVSNPVFFSSSEYLFLGKLSIPITVIWIVAITNSVNLIDGLDGLAVGVSTIGSVAMLIIAIVFNEGNVAIIIAALVGACVGFMPYNLNPAKIFMGDTGALFLGFILANLSVMGLFKMYTIISFAVPFLVVGLPLFDTVMAIVRRIIRGENPMKPDREHFHHRLIDMGMNQKQAVAFLYLISAILGLVAVVITTAGEIKAILLICALCIVASIAYFFVNSRGRREENQEQALDSHDDPNEDDKK